MLLLVSQVYYNIINVPNEANLQTAAQSQGTYSGLQSGLNGSGAGLCSVCPFILARPALKQYSIATATCIANQSLPHDPVRINHGIYQDLANI